MAENGINIPVTFDGYEEAARFANRMGDALKKMGEEGQKSARLFSEFSDKYAAAARAVTAFADAAGQRAVAQVARLTGSMAESARAGAQLGAALGPQGALVGGIVGAALPAIEQLVNAQEHAAQAAREHAAQITNLATQARALRAAQEEGGAIRTGQAGDVSGDRLDQLREEAVQRASAARRGEGVTSDVTDSVREVLIRRQVAAAEEQVRLIDLEIRRRSELRDLLIQEDRAEADRAVATAEGGRIVADTIRVVAHLHEEEEARLRRMAEASRAAAEARREELEAQADLQRLMIDLANEATAALAAQAHEVALNGQKTMETIRAINEAQRQADEDRKERMQDGSERLLEAHRKEQEAHEAQVEEYKEVTGVIVGGLTDALASIVAGQKTAEEAFKGLLSSFLKFISEKAVLRAIEEYGEAIAAFASQRYDAGAQHLAAGIAFTGLAVAAGAGAAATAPSGAASQSQGRPPESGKSSEGKGGDIVINWNSPVVTSGTRAQLGRELSGLVRAGNLRYGEA